MSETPHEVTNPRFTMRLRPDGIVHLVWAPRAVMGLDDARAAIDAMELITGGQPSPLLVDAHLAGPQDRAARNEFTSHGSMVSAVAILVGTPLSRMMGNFFIAVSQPVAPTRLFEDDATAVAWLSEYRR